MAKLEGQVSLPRQSFPLPDPSQGRPIYGTVLIQGLLELLMLKCGVQKRNGRTDEHYS